MLLMNSKGIFECDFKKVAEKLNLSEKDYGKNGEKMTIAEAQMFGNLYLQLYMGDYEKFLGYINEHVDDNMPIKDYDSSKLTKTIEDNDLVGAYAGD